MKKYLLSAAWLAVSVVPSYAQDAAANSDELAISHPDCSFFGPQRERFLPRTPNRSRVGDITIKVMGMMASPESSGATATLPSLPGGSRSYGRPTPNTSDNLIDKEIFALLAKKGVTPAEKTN